MNCSRRLVSAALLLTLTACSSNNSDNSTASDVPGPVGDPTPPVSLAEGLTCPANSPDGVAVASERLGPVINRLNQTWSAAAKQNIDPVPTDDTTQNDLVVPGGCSQGSYPANPDGYCELTHFTGCEEVYVNVAMETLAGLSRLAFELAPPTTVNLHEIAGYSHPGPDASRITDGVFAAEGASWNDPYTAVVLGWEGDGRALTINLGALATIDGTQVKVQADRHAFQVDYYDETTSEWVPYGTVPASSSSGLRTRDVVPAAGAPSSFRTRSVRLWALHPSDDDYNFSISEVQLRDTGGAIVSIGQPALGPAPYVITDGVLAAEGHSSTDPEYAVVLTHVTGSAAALGIDLGAVVDICGNGWDCLGEPTIQADNDDIYGFDYSVDGVNWITYGGQFPGVSGSGLRTRNMDCSARPDPDSPCSSSNHGPNFQARYLRVYALSGGDTFAVSELQLWDTGSRPVSVGATTFGPMPAATNGLFAPEGTTDWDDARYATILPPCKASSNSTCPPPSSPASNPALTAAFVLDLTANFPLDHLVLQADRHQFQVDASTDGVAWKPLWTVPSASGSGLFTRTSPGLGGPEARYLRVYGTAGDDSNYSVSELQVFTAQANTACPFDGGANVGEGFACSYDGPFETQIQLPDGNTDSPALTVTFHLDEAALKVKCGDAITGSTVYTLQSATDRNCSLDLQIVKNTSGGPNPAANFCAGACAAGNSILSYAQFKDLAFTAVPDSLQCDGGAMDSAIPEVIEQFVQEVAAQATETLLNGLLDYRNKPNSLVPSPQPGMCTAP